MFYNQEFVYFITDGDSIKLEYPKVLGKYVVLVEKEPIPSLIKKKKDKKFKTTDKSIHHNGLVNRNE